VNCKWDQGERRPSQPNQPAPARAEFEVAWRVFLSNRSEADLQEWRDQRDWTERKYALWDAGKRLDPPSHGPGKPCNRFMKCRCGEVFAMYEPVEVVLHVSHLSARSHGARAKRDEHRRGTGIRCLSRAP